jgi:arylsulfatase A-like enzyme
MRVSLLCAAAAAFLSPGLAPAETPERHVVVIVLDGMRPDFIRPEYTPAISKLAAEGTFFARHHPVYVSSTEVNGTAIATGVYPARSGIIANIEFRPAIDPQKSVAMEALKTIRRGDDVAAGRYIAVPTVAERLRAHGLRTVVAGSKPVALLHDRAVRPAGSCPVLFDGTVLPEDLGPAVTAAVGPVPTADNDKRQKDAWTASALLGPLWGDAVPAYTLLWLAEPDATQHAAGPGSPDALAAIRASDAVVGRVVADIARRGLTASTDILVVSDHAFSTIERKVDVAAELSQAGFVSSRAALGGLKPGQVLAVALGGTSLLYVGNHDPEVCRKLARYLQVQDWAGVILSRKPLEGTFPLCEARIDSPNAPDLFVSMRWSGAQSANGTPGMLTVDAAPSSTKVGQHASLSAYDLHNTLVAAGPDFRAGLRDELASGNIDVAPTVLWILGLREDAASLDGRVLSEALIDPSAPALRSHHTDRLEAARATLGGRWTQYLQVSEVNGVRYFDEGNGGFVAGPGH